VSLQGWVDIVLAAWLMLVSLSILGLGRQMSDLFFAIRTGRAPKTGEKLLIRAPVAPEALAFISENHPSGAPTPGTDQVILHLSSTCGGCVDAARSFVDAIRNENLRARKILANTTCLLTGSGGNKQRLNLLLDEIDLFVVEDPIASELVRQIGINVSPFALAVQDGQIAGWAEMPNFSNLERLLLKNEESRRGGPGRDLRSPVHWGPGTKSPTPSKSS
jgi:hypothetical protein